MDVDLGSFMIYKDSPGLEYIDTYNTVTEPSDKGLSFCSCREVLVNNCIKLEELSSVCHFLLALDLPLVHSGIISGRFPGICCWLE